MELRSDPLRAAVRMSSLPRQQQRGDHAEGREGPGHVSSYAAAQGADSIWKRVSKEAISLIRRMMTFEPSKRLTAEQALADVWITKNVQKGAVQIDELQESLQQLQTFRTQSNLHKAVLTYMAAHLISVEGEAKARELFETFDINHDGQLSREELLECYQTLYAGDLELARREVDKTLKNVDLNKNGTIDYNGLWT